MDTAQWPQISLVKSMEEIISATTTTTATTTTADTCSRSFLEKKAKPPRDQPLNCPRCNSTNTKFCYYNNYSLSQPRYFCKTCKRYWTEGGSLRNVPVGGGSRKNKRPSSSASSSSSSKKISDQTLLSSSQSSQNPKNHQGQDLNLAFNTMPEFVELPNIENNNNSSSSSTSTPPISSSFSAMEMLSGVPSRGLNPFMQMQAPGFGFNFGLDGLGGGGYGSVQGGQEGAGRLLFPFEDLKPVSTTEFEQNKGHADSSGYWTGMLGGGSW